jgi:hypothetical protein
MSFEGLEHPIEGVPRMPRGQRVKYVPNHRSFGAFIKSEQMRKPTAEVAEDIAALASATQPPPHEDTDPDSVGATYKVKREGGLVKVGGNLRVRVYVEGTGPGVERAEFGTEGQVRYRTLGRAGAKFGDLKHTESLGG